MNFYDRGLPGGDIDDERHGQEGKKFDDRELRRLGYSRTKFYYELADGTLLYMQNRYDKTDKLQTGSDEPKKKFRPSRPINDDAATRFDRKEGIGEHVFGLGPRRVIYNWPAIMRAGPGATVHVTEGEKNAQDLIDRGVLATCAISNKWTAEMAASLAGYDIIIHEDNDDKGRKLAALAQKALSGSAKTIRVVPCQHLWRYLDPERAKTEAPTHGDVSDWLYYGGDAAKLTEICRQLAADGAITATPHGFPDEASIPPRGFLYGHHLLRGTVSCSAGRGGLGKSTKSVAEALAMTSGKALLGIAPPYPLRVLLINLEDTRAEMDRRIAAAMRHYGLTKEDIGDRLTVIAKGEMKIKLATMTRSGNVEPDATAIRGLTWFLIEKKFDVVSVDPLRKTHRVPESDNINMGEVIEIFEEIAEAANCAVHIWHHLRKGNSGETTVDSVRGASSIIDAARSIEVLETMTKEGADKLGIDEQHRGCRFRSFSGKLNFAPPADRSDWFEIKNVELDNNPPLFGDSVGVVTRWRPPEGKESLLTPEAVTSIRMKVGVEPLWKDYPTADMWVGKAIAAVLGLDHNDAAIKRVIAKLEADGVLKKREAWDAGARKMKMYVIATASGSEANAKPDAS